jgi:hypothetical protein
LLSLDCAAVPFWGALRTPAGASSLATGDLIGSGLCQFAKTMAKQPKTVSRIPETANATGNPTHGTLLPISVTAFCSS